MRNLFPRIIVAIIGIPLLLLLAKSGPWARGMLIVLLQAMILRKWSALSAARGFRVSVIGIVIAVAGLDVLVMMPHPAALSVGFSLFRSC